MLLFLPAYFHSDERMFCAMSSEINAQFVTVSVKAKTGLGLRTVCFYEWSPLTCGWCFKVLENQFHPPTKSSFQHLFSNLKIFCPQSPLQIHKSVHVKSFMVPIISFENSDRWHSELENPSQHNIMRLFFGTVWKVMRIIWFLRQYLSWFSLHFKKSRAAR